MTLALLATALLIPTIAAYALVCWVWPFRRHTACKGTGTRPALLTKRLKPCRRCGGSGMVLRLGRTIYNSIAATYRDAEHARGGQR